MDGAHDGFEGLVDVQRRRVVVDEDARVADGVLVVRGRFGVAEEAAQPRPVDDAVAAAAVAERARRRQRRPRAHLLRHVLPLQSVHARLQKPLQKKTKKKQTNKKNDPHVFDISLAKPCETTVSV